jgi:hypothetical protein
MPIYPLQQGIKGLTDLGGLIKHKYMWTCVNDSSFIEFIYNVLDSFIHVFVRLLLLFIDMYYTCNQRKNSELLQTMV